jgi:hypothetical protein
LGIRSGKILIVEKIANRILEKYGENYSISEIIDRFIKNFKDNTEGTDRKDNSKKWRGRKPVFYRLVKEVEKK